MSKAAVNGANFFSRTSSYSTHSSRTGRNLLGWELPENMTQRQKWDAIHTAHKSVLAEIIELSKLPKTLSHKQLVEISKRRAELVEMEKILVQLKAVYPTDARRVDFGTCICQVVKIDVTKAKWDSYIAQAKELYDRAQMFETAEDKQDE